MFCTRTVFLTLLTCIRDGAFNWGRDELDLDRNSAATAGVSVCSEQTWSKSSTGNFGTGYGKCMRINLIYLYDHWPRSTFEPLHVYQFFSRLVRSYQCFFYPLLLLQKDHDVCSCVTIILSLVSLPRIWQILMIFWTKKKSTHLCLRISPLNLHYFAIGKVPLQTM